MSIVPQTYEDWQHCITVKCGIPLTADFVAARINELEDPGNYRTKKFIDAWGNDHHAKTLDWFRQAATQIEQHALSTDQSVGT
ncbi:MAG: hypothetical protein AAF216_01885 [Pseudomonadota bacterium]